MYMLAKFITYLTYIFKLNTNFSMILIYIFGSFSISFVRWEILSIVFNMGYQRTSLITSLDLEEMKTNWTAIS